MQTLEEENSGLPLFCLDVHFYYNYSDNCFATKLHQKRDDPKFAGKLKFTRFPHAYSFISHATLYSTFAGLLVTLHYV